MKKMTPSAAIANRFFPTLSQWRGSRVCLEPGPEESYTVHLFYVSRLVCWLHSNVEEQVQKCDYKIVDWVSSVRNNQTEVWNHKFVSKGGNISGHKVIHWHAKRMNFERADIYSYSEKDLWVPSLSMAFAMAWFFAMSMSPRPRQKWGKIRNTFFRSLLTSFSCLKDRK